MLPLGLQPPPLTLDVRRLGVDVLPYAVIQQAHELVMESSRLATEGLKLLAICVEQRRDGLRHPRPWPAT